MAALDIPTLYKQGKNDSGKSTDAMLAQNHISQVYDYLWNSKTNYGVLFTMTRFWFLKRDGKVLYGSKHFNHDCTKPGIIGLLFFITDLAIGSWQSVVEDLYSQKLVKMKLIVEDCEKKEMADDKGPGGGNGGSSHGEGSSHGGGPSGKNFSISEPVDVYFRGELGKGRHGSWKGCVDGLGDVAVKSVRIEDEDCKLLKNEARIYKQLGRMLKRKDILPKLYSFSESRPGELSLMISCIDGKNLAEWLEKKHDMHEILIVRENCSECMELIHDCGIIHGDIKAENFIVRPNLDVVVVDFETAENVNVNGEKRFLEELREVYCMFYNYKYT